LAELALFVTWVLATILIAAALAKILSKHHSPSSLVIAGIEGALGLFLVAGLALRLSAVLAAIVFAGYFLYAFWFSPQERHQWFGDRLPATSAGAQRVRNGLIFALAVALVFLGQLSSGRPTTVALGASIGVLVGLIIVALPWAFDMARGL
jgi:hypothetical protein